MQQVWAGPSDRDLETVAAAALRYYQTVGTILPDKSAIASEVEYYAKVRKNIDC